MKTARITLDGQAIQVPAGTTLWEAARSRGISIPTFCRNEALRPKAACYVCVVEVEGQADLVPSCSTEAVDGMVVRTGTERVLEARRACVELLLSDHLGDCVGPCMSACPAGIDIPGFISHLAAGDAARALALIRRNMPLPGVLGRICKKPCEDACRRQLVEEPVAICHLKRFAADAVAESGETPLPRKAPATGKKVAVVGAGPAGLSAAYYLELLGHDCTVFDARARAGGMLRYGIPSFRLPEAVIDREAAVVERLGAEFKFNTCIGEDVTLNELRHEYDAVFLALGAQKALTLGLPGEDASGVYTGLALLGQGTEKFKIGKKAIVIGGGDVAIDAARTARRMGCRDVLICCLERPEEMPAGKAEIAECLAEGIRIRHGFGVKNIETKAGKVTGVVLKRCTSVFDASGRFHPEYDEDDTASERCQTLVVAIGQAVDAGGLYGVRRSGPGIVSADPRSMQTDVPGLFAGGDCATGPQNAVKAVAAGRRAAVAIDQFVLGCEVTGETVCYEHTMGPLEAVPRAAVERFESKPRIPLPSLDPRTRADSFDEVETGFTRKMVLAEASRCMACGCRDAHECKLRLYATLFGASADRFAGERREYDLDDSHPEIVYQAHKCIQCRTCVRITEEILGNSAMQVVGRGFTARVRPADGKALQFVDDARLGQIVDSCPVGALTRKTDPVPTLDPVFRRPGVTC